MGNKHTSPGEVDIEGLPIQPEDTDLNGGHLSSQLDGKNGISGNETDFNTSFQNENCDTITTEDDLDVNCIQIATDDDIHYSQIISSEELAQLLSQSSAEVQSRGTNIDRLSLDVSHLEDVHIIDALLGKYTPDRDHFDTFLHKELSKVEISVCALSKNKGQPFASGLIIAPDLILTSRSCIENIEITSVYIRVGFQLTHYGLSYGSNIQAKYIVENNIYLDYAIIRISEPIRHYVDIDISSNVVNDIIFISHPNGGPKRVTVSNTLERNIFTSEDVKDKNSESVMTSEFHDSFFSHANSICFDSHGKVYALYSVSSTTGVVKAIFISTIVAESKIFAFLHLLKKKQKSLKVNYNKYYKSYCDLKTILSPAVDSKSDGAISLNGGMVVNDNLLPPKLEVMVTLEQDYYRIIPDGELQFLWLLGKETIKIGNELRLCVYRSHGYSVDSLRWAPWNLFAGPATTYRFDYNPEVGENSKPLSFDKDLWDAVHKLRESIEMCWLARLHLNKSLQHLYQSYSTENVLLDSTYILPRGESNAETTPHDSDASYSPPTRDVIEVVKRSSQSTYLLKVAGDVKVRGVKEYVKQQNHVLTALRNVASSYRKLFDANSLNFVHRTEITDWHEKRNNKVVLINVSETVKQ